MSIKKRIFDSVKVKAEKNNVECDSNFNDKVNSIIDEVIQQDSFQMLDSNEVLNEHGLGINNAVENGIIEGTAEGIAYSVIEGYEGCK